jgi:hypothetical protein
MQTLVTLTAIGAAGLLATGAPALAADPGFYLGGGAGIATLKADPPEFDDVDEEDTAWKVFAGYRLDLIPFLDLAGELTYRDFGNPDGEDFEFEADGYDASLLAIVPAGPIDLVARLGIGNYGIDSVVDGTNEDDDSSSALYGVGVGFRIWRVNLRAEWERVEPDGVDSIDMYSINACFRF